jgi:hypothetical protein
MFRSVPDQLQQAEFVQLYSKMAQTLALSGVVGQSPSALLSIQIPGVVVKPGLDPNDPETEYYVSNFLNLTLECNYVATAKAASVSDVYKLILDGKELPLIDLSPAEKKMLAEARAYLFDATGEPTPQYTAYIDYGQRYYAAQDALEAAQASHDNGGPKVSASIKEAFAKASENWLDKGHKEDVDRSLAVIEQLEGKDPFPYWQALAKKFKLHTRTLDNGSEYQRVTSLPPYEQWFDMDLWTPFSFDANDYRNQRRSGGTGMKGDGCCCCSPKPSFESSGEHGRIAMAAQPRAGFGPGFGLNRPQPRPDASLILSAFGEGTAVVDTYAPEPARDGFSEDELKLECSFKRINIVRPWMDANVFYSRFWRWSQQSIGWGIILSTGGTVAGNQPASGVIPVLPMAALLAKDIKVTTASARVAGWAEGHLKAGRSVRYGPFLLEDVAPAPEGLMMASGAPATARLSGAPQIFGYISTIFPESPNPDLTIVWPT